MSTLTSPSRTFAEQHAFNRQVWERLIEDPTLATFEGKVETDRDGNLIMSPPPEWPHPTYANAIAKFLDRLLPEGGWLVEASVSTPEGVKIPDVAWYGPERAAAYDATDERVLGAVVPDLCVEVQSKSNTPAEFEGKRQAYFAAGAHEVWICDLKGRMSFYGPEGQRERSLLCPAFPVEVPDKLRLLP